VENDLNYVELPFLLPSPLERGWGEVIWLFLKILESLNLLMKR